MFSNLFPLHPTVVRTPQFYYHLTTIDGIDLPHLAFSVTESQISATVSAWQMGFNTGQNSAFQGADRI